ncbi:MAG: alpha/beta hydrolase, partial [Candidatus Helarchaeota archaeon]
MKSKRIQYITLIFFTALMLVGIIGLNFYPINILRTTHQVSTNDGVVISYNIYQPIGLSEPTPVVVMGHGIIVNKEMLTNFAMELASRGYIVANLDWRGHGQSTGELNHEKLLLDLEAVIADIPKRVAVANMSALALAGYSMGGWPTFQYALEHNDTVKAWVGIATSGNEITANQTNPNNVLLIIGDLDEAFTINTLKIDMVNLTGASGVNDVQLNTLYGNMADGSARKLQVIPGVDHLMAPWTRAFVFSATNWIIESFGGTQISTSALMTFDLRIDFLTMAIIGLLGVTILLALILANKLKIRKSSEEKTSELKEEMIQDHSTLSFIGKYYGFTFGLFPTIFALIPLVLLPLPITSFLSMLVGCLGFNLLFYCWRLSKKYDLSIKTALKENISRNPKIWIFSLILGIMFFLGFELSFGLNYLGIIPSVNRILYLFLFIPLCFLTFFMYGIFIQKYSTRFFYSKLKIKNSIVKQIINSFINFLLIYSWFVVIILMACVFLGSFFFAMILILMIPIFLLVSFLSVYFEEITGSIIPSALLHAIILSFLILTLTPF